MYFFFQAEDGIRDVERSRGLGDVYKRQGRPLGVLKYAMTLDGKIATTTGHSAWVTSPAARARVFETRSPVSYTHLTLPTN